MLCVLEGVKVGSILMVDSPLGSKSFQRVAKITKLHAVLESGTKVRICDGSVVGPKSRGFRTYYLLASSKDMKDARIENWVNNIRRKLLKLGNHVNGITIDNYDKVDHIIDNLCKIMNVKLG